MGLLLSFLTHCADLKSVQPFMVWTLMCMKRLQEWKEWAERGRKQANGLKVKIRTYVQSRILQSFGGYSYSKNIRHKQIRLWFEYAMINLLKDDMGLKQLLMEHFYVHTFAYYNLFLQISYQLVACRQIRFKFYKLNYKLNTLSIF